LYWRRGWCMLFQFVTKLAAPVKKIPAMEKKVLIMALRNGKIESIT